MRLSLAVVAAAHVAFFFWTAAPVRAAEEIDMRAGTSRVLRLPQVLRVAVGDESVLGVMPLPGKTQILINARKAGRTTLIAWTGSGEGVEHDFQITVRADDVDLLGQMIQAGIASRDVAAQAVGRSVVVRGSVADPGAVQQVTEVLARFEPLARQEGVTLVNAVVFTRPLQDLNRAVSGDPNLAGVRAEPDGQGNVVVSGRVKNDVVRQVALAKIRGEAGQLLSAKGQVVDRLVADGATQVNVNVRVLEIDDTGLKQLGVSLNGAVPRPNGGYIVEGPSFNLIDVPGSSIGFGPFFRATRVAATIDALQQTGHARMLSEPNLTTVPGQEATFLVGGQVPIPQSAGLGAISVIYQPYGVQLNVNPTILGNGDISTKIAPEISDLDFQDGVLIGGFQIPALKVSKLSTNVITAPGQSIVMGGLLRRVEDRTIRKVPLLSQLPILGPLFQDVRYQRGETNVVFVMTPQVVTQ